MQGLLSRWVDLLLDRLQGTRDVLVDKAREWKLPLYLLSWDFSKAFDSVEWHAILRLLSDKAVSPAVQRALVLGFSHK